MEVLTLLLFLTVIWLFIRDLTGRGKMRDLEARLRVLHEAQASLSRELAARPAPAKKAAAAKAAAAPAVSAVPEPRRPLPWENQRLASEPTPEIPDFAPKPPRDWFGPLAKWVSGHWVYVIAAVSLALAGVFMVQYGIENGLLTPQLRVLGALLLGTALIAGGEYLRRKGGDGAGDFFAYIPSTFAAGGLITLFGGIWAAHGLYGLIGPNAALAGLVLVAALAIAIGWFYGPLLAAIGILGSILAPFLTGGDSGQAWLLIYYFLLIAVTGLAVDALRRWAWLSAGSVILAFLAATGAWLGGGADLHFAVFALALFAATATIPTLKLVPDLQGLMLSEVFRPVPNGKLNRPDFPALLALLGLALACVISMMLHDGSEGTFWLSIALQILLFALVTIWLRDSRALEDAAALPAAAFLATIAFEALGQGQVFVAWYSATIEWRTPEMQVPGTVWVLMALATALTLTAAWRSILRTDYPAIWACAAALFAPATAILLEILWQPSSVAGPWPWALCLIAVAGVMTLLAERAARIDGPDRRRFALFALSALSMITFAFFMVLTAGALTVALAAMIAVAALMDRQWSLKIMSLFIQIGSAVLAYRLLVDPGLEWGMQGRLWEVVLSYLGTVALLWAALRALNSETRQGAIAALEGAIWTFSGIFASLLIARWIEHLGPPYSETPHPFIGLFATVWLLSLGNQLWRIKTGPGLLRRVRIVLAAIYAVAAAALLAANLFVLNPVLLWNTATFGPWLLDSLATGYLLPALPLAFITLRMPHLPRWLRLGTGVTAALLAAVWVALEIRRFWRGDNLAVPGTTQPELYSYTVAMLVLAAGLLALAYSRRSPLIRKLALAAVALTVAKVFFIDTGGLTGLIRVVSFLVLGLVLAGLAWVNRWFVAMESRDAPKAEPDPPPAGD